MGMGEETDKGKEGNHVESCDSCIDPKNRVAIRLCYWEHFFVTTTWLSVNWMKALSQPKTIFIMEWLLRKQCLFLCPRSTSYARQLCTGWAIAHGVPKQKHYNKWLLVYQILNNSQLKQNNAQLGLLWKEKYICCGCMKKSNNQHCG